MCQIPINPNPKLLTKYNVGQTMGDQIKFNQIKRSGSETHTHFLFQTKPFTFEK